MYGQHIRCYIEHLNTESLVKLHHCGGTTHTYSNTVTQAQITGFNNIYEKQHNIPYNNVAFK